MELTTNKLMYEDQPEQLPLISVVMTTYNGEKYLEHQLDSIFLQTYKNIEVVVTDDGSTDRTPVILNEYACRYPQLKVYINEKNLGFVKNFEKACTLSKGSFIALCDQDDWWDPHKLEKLYRGIGHHPMIYCNSRLCNEQLEDTGATISDRAVLAPITSPLQQAVFCRIYGHATLITRNLVQKAIPFLEVIPHDWWLSFMATLHGGIAYLDEPLVHYRQHEANLFGAVGGKKRKKEKERKRSEIRKIRSRIHAFYTQCPNTLKKEKKILGQLVNCYSSFSLIHDFQRMIIFFRYYHDLLFVKKRSKMRKILFCFKMFAIVK